MARSSQLFVGPYAEWADVGGGFTSDDPRWADLLDGGSLEWNIGISGWAYVRRGERQVEVACCMPAQPRHGCRRWPMSVTLAHGDWSAGADFVADWTGTDPGGELDWFAAAFAGELAVARELTGVLPVLRWGLLFWVTG